MICRRLLWAMAVLWCLQWMSVASWADEKAWTQYVKDGSFYVTLKDHPDLELELWTHGGCPEVVAFSPSFVRPDVWLLIYYAGSAGTRYMAVIYEAYVIDIKHSRVLGKAPWKIDVDESGFPSPGFSQPEWVWKHDKIVISTSGGKDQVIPLPEK